MRSTRRPRHRFAAARPRVNAGVRPIEMDEKARDSWARVLNPEHLREHLILVSMFVTAYEMLEDSIIGKLKSFYTFGFNQDEETVSAEYQAKVLSKNRSPLHASMSWLKESGAVDDTDFEKLKRIKDSRNSLVHELPEYLLSRGLPSDIHERFGDVVELLQKIERWWAVNVDMACDTQWDGKDIDVEKITPGSVLILKMLLDVASGENKYQQEFNRIWPAV